MSNVFKAQKAEFAECIDVLLTPEKYPIAFKNKVDELMEQEAFDTKEEAEHWVRTTPIGLEIFYEKHSGLFAIESDAVESGCCTSPYTQMDIEVEE